MTDYLALKPEGPFFGLFALGAVAAVPAGHVGPWAAVSICAATALLCILISYVSSFRRRPHEADATSQSVCAEEGPQPLNALVHAARYALAISIAGVAGLLLGVGHANWAMAAAAVPLAAADASSRVHRGIHRVVGTFVGLVVTALLLLPNLSGTLLAVCVMALLFPTELFMARHYALALGFFTPLIMVMTELADPSEPLTLLAERGIDTLIGVGVGIAVAVVIRGPGHGDPHDPVAVTTPPPTASRDRRGLRGHRLDKATYMRGRIGSGYRRRRNRLPGIRRWHGPGLPPGPSGSGPCRARRGDGARIMLCANPEEFAAMTTLDSTPLAPAAPSGSRGKLTGDFVTAGAYRS